MNCDEFIRRMHWRIDQRLSLDDDAAMRRHAHDCQSCRARMQTWGSIDSVISGQSSRSTSAATPSHAHRRSTVHAAGLAAVVLLAWTTFQWKDASSVASLDNATLERDASGTVAANGSPALHHDRSKQAPLSEQARLEQNPTDRIGTAEGRTMIAGVSRPIDPGIWWRDVQNRDWIDQTMPAVRSVRQSVAPLGRSLMRAVTILTTGHGEQTS